MSFCLFQLLEAAHTLWLLAPSTIFRVVGLDLVHLLLPSLLPLSLLRTVVMILVNLFIVKLSD